ncbi:AraC family transcriptional regulator [Algoriphagus lacus]|uniref:AraC family transcriptional regulator n=1 Tax=Algoriphagus lacus TaxID=2056311 RepID=A0A418PN83_9BACT|nr:helix-turn-helix transcriptional regulator [Algoriphagus lacus]RIW13354.1 AraC family transcriptional regulator [Algoriphagus lacus]
MRQFNFEPKKYGFELMMDLYSLEDIGKDHFEAKPHTLDFFEILILENGTGTLSVNQFSTQLQPFTLVFASPGQVKRNDIQTNKGFHLVFKEDFLATFFSDKLFVHRMRYFFNTNHPQFFSVKPEDYDLLRIILSELQREIQNYKTDSPHLLRALLYYLLAKLNRLYCEHFGILDQEFIHDVYQLKEAINHSIRKFHTVKEYCHLLGKDQGHLNKIIKSATGQTISELIRDRLIQEIKSELLYSKKSIFQIALDLGFSEPNNLSRFFSNYTGMSPSVFREHSN